MFRSPLALALAFLMTVFAPVAQSAEKPDWRGWTADLFATAKAQNKLVLLNMEAVWCHWCHVMDERTYADDAVRNLIARDYIAVRVDQDANPDLASRYGDWGWPATIVFSPEGEELAKYRGFIPPGRMAAELEAIALNPVPGPSIAETPEIVPAKLTALTEAQRTAILDIYEQTWDEQNGGWGRNLKFIHADTLDYALEKARFGDEEAARKAKKTLDGGMYLIDPVWGGVFQYSDQLDWSSPHYEKIMSYQRDYLTLYSDAYALFGEKRYLAAAKAIRAWLRDQMTSPEGAFYTSQDADLDKETPGRDFYALDKAGRAALGRAPRIDTNLYARENGWAISGLVALHGASGDDRALAEARRAADWIVANRSLPGGGFAHGDKDRGGPFLGDTLAMGKASLDLYFATGERQWLMRASDAADFIDRTFRDAQAGFAATARSAADAGVFRERFRNIEENTDVARFANILSRTLATDRHRAIALHAMRFLASDAVNSQRRFMTGVLLADEALSIEPAHITVIGPKGDPETRALHAAARALPFRYRRIDWWDRAEGPLANPDVQYPELDRPAVFACANQVCSLPMTDADELSQTVKGMLAIRQSRR